MGNGMCGRAMTAVTACFFEGNARELRGIPPFLARLWRGWN
jgi:hypothetical protein